MDLLENFLIDVWANCRLDFDAYFSAELFNLLFCRIKSLFHIRYALDRDRGLIVSALAELPFNNTEHHFVFFAQVDNLIKSLGIEKVARKLERESLSTDAAAIGFFLFSCALVQGS